MVANLPGVTICDIWFQNVAIGIPLFLIMVDMNIVRAICSSMQTQIVFCVACFLNGDWFMQRGQTPMFAREIIYTPYFYLLGHPVNQGEACL